MHQQTRTYAQDGITFEILSIRNDSGSAIHVKIVDIDGKQVKEEPIRGGVIGRDKWSQQSSE